MTTFLGGGDGLFHEGDQVISAKQGRIGNIISSRSFMGTNVYSILDDAEDVFEAYEDELLRIW